MTEPTREDIIKMLPAQQDEYFLAKAKDHGMIVGQGPGLATHRGKPLDEYGRKLSTFEHEGKAVTVPDRALRKDPTTQEVTEKPRIHAVGLETELGFYETPGELARAYCRYHTIGTNVWD